MSPFKKYNDDSEDNKTVILAYESQEEEYVNPWLNVADEDYYPL